MMRSCESYEMHISALIDGEASRADTLAILDHLPGCNACQTFYRDCRDLQDVADAMPVEVDVSSATPAPTAAPERIVRFPRPMRWTWAAAAGVALLFVAGAIGLRPSTQESGPTGPRVIDLSVESPSAPMDDERFMEISVALLRADARYQRTMIEILERFERNRGLDESSVDVASSFTESDEPWTSSSFDDSESSGSANARPQP